MPIQPKKALANKSTRASITNIKKNIKISQDAEEILTKVKSKGFTRDSFISQAVLAHYKTVFGSVSDRKEDILDGKMNYLLAAIGEAQTGKALYDDLKSKKPNLVNSIVKRIKKINFDIDKMELQRLNDARESKKVSTKDLYTVAFAVKYGFHKEERNTISKTASK